MRRRETRRRRRCAPRATIPQTTLHDAIFWAPPNSPRSDPSTPALPPSSQLTPAPAPEPAPAPIKKKKKKKKKKKSAAAEEEEDEDEVDEVTAALRELGEEMPPARDDAVDPNAPPGSSSAPRDPLMTVDLRCLKAEDELKSIFGARVIHAVELEEGNRGGGGGARAGSRGRRGRSTVAASLASAARARSILVAPKDSWPPYRRGTGLSMECVGVDRDGARVFRYTHDSDYADAQRAYNRAVASHNPNNLVALLHHYPWHVDALLALSDIYIYTGEGQHSAEMLERCLFALEGAWHPWFAEAAAAGTARIDGSGAHQPNDAFFSAVFKHVQALTRRGCHRAALECAKLALSLDRSDPKGLLCCVDYFALRCGEANWLLDLAADFGGDGRLLALPGFAYSTALARLAGGRPRCQRLEGLDDDDGGEGKGKAKARGKTPSKLTAEERAEADDALLAALLAHPAAAKALVARLDASAAASDPRWVAALTHPHFADARDSLGNRGLEHLCDLFAERHHLLWKAEDAFSWLRDGATRAIAAADTRDAPATLDGLCAGDYAAMRAETFPEGEERNPYAHLSVADFSDDVKRQMPEGDENPFLQRPEPVPGPAPAPEELVEMFEHIGPQLRGLPGFDEAAAARLGDMTPEEAAQFREGLIDAIEAQRGAEAAAEEEDEDEGAAARQMGNPLLEFFRTMFVPEQGDRGEGLRREMNRQNAPEEEDHEN